MHALPLSLLPWLALITLHWVQHDLVGVVCTVVLVALAPVVAHCVSEDVAGSAEVCGGDASTDIRVALESVLGILVPEVERAVGARGGEGSVYGVERDGIDRENVLSVAIRCRRGAVAFEAEVVGLLVLGNVLDGTAAFDAANGVTGSVVECADSASLPLERRLDGLEEGAWVLEVDDVNPAFGCGDDEEVCVVRAGIVPDVHAVDAILAGDGRDRRLLAKIPVFDGLVPAASDEHVLTVDEDALDALDGLIVRCNLLCSCTTGAEIQHACSFVCTCAKHLLTILGPTAREHRSFMLKHRLALTLSAGVDLVYPDLLVPACDGEVIALWREAHVGDAVLGRVRERNIFAEVALGRVCAGRRGRAAEESHVGVFRGSRGGAWRGGSVTLSLRFVRGSVAAAAIVRHLRACLSR
jgi:hypothetical protein